MTQPEEDNSNILLSDLEFVRDNYVPFMADLSSKTVLAKILENHPELQQEYYEHSLEELGKAIRSNVPQDLFHLEIEPDPLDPQDLDIPDTLPVFRFLTEVEYLRSNDKTMDALEKLLDALETISFDGANPYKSIDFKPKAPRLLAAVKAFDVELLEVLNTIDPDSESFDFYKYTMRTVYKSVINVVRSLNHFRNEEDILGETRDFLEKLLLGLRAEKSIAAMNVEKDDMPSYVADEEYPSQNDMTAAH